MNTQTVADYLLTRLSQAGVISVFGVPGDYNFGILDAIAARPALAWQGMATEQGAGYAADSYARLRGLGAVVTTFGVGELSAINAIAGAYAESVPVVHIVGTPALSARNADVALHHNLPGDDFEHFARMAAEVTAAQADLRPATAPAEIDRVLRTAIRTSRPVYIAIPADVASAPVPAPQGRLPQVEDTAAADPTVLAAFAGHVRSLLDTAASASVLVGQLAARYQVTSFVRDLAAAGGLPVAVLATAKGDFPESHPCFAGLYAGAASAKRARAAVEDTDVLITVGVTLYDTVTGGRTHQLPADRRIDLGPDRARIGGTVYPGVSLREGLAIVTTAVRGCAGHLTASLPPAEEGAAAPVAGARLTQRALWASLQRFVEPDDMVIADQGTAFYGAAGLHLARRGAAARPAAVGVDRLGRAGRCRRHARRTGPAADPDHRRWRPPADRRRARHAARPRAGADHHRAEQRRLHDRADDRRPVGRLPRHPRLGLDGIRRGRRPGDAAARHQGHRFARTCQGTARG